MDTLEVRLLGGFSVRWRGAPVKGFESRNVRALMAYLLLHRDQPPFTRDRLALTFWPDADTDGGRQNLRQALYNLRRTLPAGDEPPIITSNLVAGWNPAFPVWVDVTAVEEGVGRGLREDVCRDPAALEEAARAYGGDLLAGLPVDSSYDFEEWLLFRQEQLREGILKALGALAAHHARRGDAAEAARWGRRRVELDPLSEEAHRDLMRYYAQNGERSRALAQFEHCRYLLREEMGVPPLRETQVLFEEIAATETSPPVMPEESRSWPMLKMVGRTLEFGRLRRDWDRVTTGAARVTLITGLVGTGKSRLVRSAAHDAAGRVKSVVVAARALPGAVPLPYGVLASLVRSVHYGGDATRQVLEQGIAEGFLAPLAGLRPRLAGGRPQLGGIPTAGELSGALSALVSMLVKAEGGSGIGSRRPLIVLLDDLQWADQPSLEVLALVRREVAELPVWFLMAAAGGEDRGRGREPANGAVGGAHADVMSRLTDLADDVYVLGVLEPDAIGQMVGNFFDGPDREFLADRLAAVSGGVPIAVADWINLLCDEKMLQWAGEGRWVAGGDLRRWWESAPGSYRELVSRRVAILPSSTRRLLVMAAVIGTVFDAELLGEAAEEHPIVLETGLSVLLERSLIRHVPAAWFESRRERDLEMWRRGARRGSFEFAHRGVQREVYESVSRGRRRTLHAQAAGVLRRRADGVPGRTLAELARHELAAQEWLGALKTLEVLAAWSHSLGAAGTAAAHLEVAAIAANRLAADAATTEERRRWAKRARELAQEAQRRRRESGGRGTGRIG